MRWKVAEGYCWAITQAADGMLRPIRFQCAGVWISAGLPCIYACSWRLAVLAQFPLAPTTATYTARQIQHLSPTQPTKTALTNYTDRRIQHLPPNYNGAVCSLASNHPFILLLCQLMKVNFTQWAHMSRFLPSALFVPQVQTQPTAETSCSEYVSF